MDKDRARLSGILALCVIAVVITAAVYVGRPALALVLEDYAPTKDTGTRLPRPLPPPQAPTRPPAPQAALPPQFATVFQKEVANAGVAQPTELESKIFELTNAERTARNLPALEWDLRMVTVARRHSEDMRDRGYFDHVSPEQIGHGHRVAMGHRTLLGLAGENIGDNSATSSTPGHVATLPATDILAATRVESWMNSPGHKANILRPEFTHLGVGCALDDAGSLVLATQNFAVATAYLDADVPEAVAAGGSLALQGRLASAGGTLPHKLGVVDLASDQIVAEAVATGSGDAFSATVALQGLRSGHYRVVALVPTSPGSFNRIPGPYFDVR